MKKKILLAFLSLAFLGFPVFASDKFHVEALEDFSSENPNNFFKAKLIEDATFGETFMIKGDVINCEVKEVTDPTRAKRNARIYFKLLSYEDKIGVHNFNGVYVAKYAKTILSKEEIEKIPPKQAAKKTIRLAGNLVVAGFSTAFSFFDGVHYNKEGNRFKSGVKQAYDDSLFSYIGYGQEVEIKTGDEFYLIVKKFQEEK